MIFIQGTMFLTDTAGKRVLISGFRQSSFNVLSGNESLDSTFRDAGIKTHHVILRGLNAVTGFPRRVCPRTGIICIFRQYHYPRGNRRRD